MKFRVRGGARSRWQKSLRRSSERGCGVWAPVHGRWSLKWCQALGCQVPALQDKDRSRPRARLRPSGQNPVSGAGRPVRLEGARGGRAALEGLGAQAARRLGAGPAQCTGSWEARRWGGQSSARLPTCSPPELEDIHVAVET